MSAKSPITTHVLDTARGSPAAGVDVTLENLSEGRWQSLATGVTNADGRIGDLLPTGSLAAGRYRLIFATGEYYRGLDVDGFYPQVTVDFEINQTNDHYHVPLLLSPFGYSTYRGS